MEINSKELRKYHSDLLTSDPELIARITPEILLSIGFKYNDRSSNYTYDGYSLNKEGDKWWLSNDESGSTCYRLRYVEFIHQVRKLYTALEDKEITIDKKK